MADITLRHPANGANQVIPSEKFDHIAFDFPADSVSLSREGDDLVLSFEDGSRISLADFYATFSKDSIPDFIVDGTPVSGSEFFAALNEPDLMPAAGPAAASNADGGRFHEYTDASLMDGVERLGGLDLGLNRSAEPERGLEAYGNRGVAEEEPAAEEVTVPERPQFEGDDGTGVSKVITDEGNLEEGGSKNETDATTPYGASAKGSFKMELHGADATVKIGGTEFTVKDGKLYYEGAEVGESNSVVVSGGEPGKSGEHGTLTVTGMDADGNVHYTYELTSPVDATDKTGNVTGEGDAGRGEAIQADTFEVTITTVGGKAEGQITVDALDDVPVLTTLESDAGEVAASATELKGTLEFTPGADSDGAQVTVVVDGQTFTGTKQLDGSWEFKGGQQGYSFALGEKNTFTYTRPTPTTDEAKENGEIVLKVTVTDGDGDTAKSEVSVNTVAKPQFEGDDGTGVSKVTTDEGNLSGGSGHEITGTTDTIGTSATGSFQMELHDADAEVTLGATTFTVKDGELLYDGKKVTESNSVDVLVAKPDESGESGKYGEHGKLTVTGMDVDKDGNYNVHYTYELTSPVDATDKTGNVSGEGDAGRGEAIQADTFEVTITTVGGEAKGQITVDALDDAPVLTVTHDKVTEHAADMETGTIEDTFTVHFGADGAGDANGNPEFTFDGNKLTPGTEDGTWTYTDSDNHYTVTVTQNSTDGNKSTYSYKLEYDSTKVGEGLGGNLVVKATDKDGDTATSTIAIAVENEAPEAVDDVFNVYKPVTGESVISASASATLGGHIITVGGNVGKNISADWMEGKQDGNFDTLTQSAGKDLFGKFFSDLGGNELTLDTLKDAAHIYTLEITDNTSNEQIQAAVKQASDHNLLLYIEGDLTSDKLGSERLNCVTIVNGNFTVNSDGFSADSFLYVTGNMQANKNFEVSGGLAVGGDLTGPKYGSSVSIEVEHTADVFTPDNVVISSQVGEGETPTVTQTISFDQLLNNDTDPDTDPDATTVSKDGLHITEITIGKNTYTADGSDSNDIEYSKDTHISINWEKGTISVTNTGKNSEAITFGYEVADRHGATDTASVTVNVNAMTNAGSTGDDLLQGVTTTDQVFQSCNISFVLDNSGSMDKCYDTAKQAVADYIQNLYDDIQGTDAVVNIQIIKFNKKVDYNQPFQLTGSMTSDALNTILDAVKNGSANGTTNYEAALNAAKTWFNSMENANNYDNKLFFITDGYPNKSTSSGKDHVENAVKVYNAIVGSDADNPKVDVHAIGILGNGANELDVLDKFDNTPGDDGKKATIIEKADELYEALTSSTVTKPVSDTVFANKGDDVVFGDTAQFMVDGAAVSLAEYVKAQLSFNPSIADVIDYVREHPEEIDGALVPNHDANKPDMPDALIGGEGHDVMYGQGGEDLLIGDGSNVAATGDSSTDTLHQLADKLAELTGQSHESTPSALNDAILGLTSDPEKLHTLADWSEQKLESTSDGNDWLFGGEGKDVLFGLGGNDHLYGGAGDDILFGGGGDDYLDGGAGQDRLFGGSGNDIIKYDANDFLVDGGDGIDFLITNDKTLSLDDLLNNADPNNGPIVQNVEVLISGDNALSLTDTAALNRYGIELGLDEGKETLTLSGAWTWTQTDNGGVFVNDDAGLTIQVSSGLVVDDANDQAAIHKFILENAQ